MANNHVFRNPTYNKKISKEEIEKIFACAESHRQDQGVINDAFRMTIGYDGTGWGSRVDAAIRDAFLEQS